MELALESYDVCIGLLQRKPKTPEGKHYTINLPNLRVDAAISVEEVSVLAYFWNHYNPHYQHVMLNFKKKLMFSQIMKTKWCSHFEVPLKECMFFF